MAGSLGLILAHGAGLSGCKTAFPTSSKQMQPGHRRAQHCSSTKLAVCEGAAAVSRPDHCAVRARELPRSLVTRETRKRRAAHADAGASMSTCIDHPASRGTEVQTSAGGWGRPSGPGSYLPGSFLNVSLSQAWQLARVRAPLATCARSVASVLRCFSVAWSLRA